MTIQRMEHLGIVVDDLAAATAFFVELGLKGSGRPPTASRAFALARKLPRATNGPPGASVSARRRR